MPNNELLQATLDYIKTHPEKWDQKLYAKQTECGTAFCFAGWAVRIGTGKPLDIFWQQMYDEDYKVAHDLRDGTSIPEKAISLLDIDSDDGYELFSSGNTLNDLERKVNTIITEGTLQPPDSDDYDDSEDYDDDPCTCDLCSS